MYRPSVLLASGGLDAAAIAERCGLSDVDRVLVRPAPWWMERLWIGPVWAMTLPWGIFVDPDRLGDPRLPALLVHELVHVRQWQQLGVGLFLIRYVGDYLRSRFRGLDHRQAYLSIRAEVEARTVAGV